MQFQSFRQVINRVVTGAHHQEPATTPYSCHGVFTDRSIFSLNFSRIQIPTRLQNSRFRKAGSAVSVILECEAREPHTPALSPFSLAVFSLAPAFRSNRVCRSRSQKIRLFCSLLKRLIAWQCMSFVTSYSCILYQVSPQSLITLRQSFPLKAKKKCGVSGRYKHQAALVP